MRPSKKSFSYRIRPPKSCSTTNRVIRALDREALLIVSATPLLNHLRDFWVYVNLIWRHEWPFTHGGESDPISPETFYNEYAWDTIKRGEEFKKLGMARLLGRVPKSLDLMKLLCIRRGMLTRLELPDKSVVSPGDSLRMYTSRVVRLRCTPSDARQTARLCERHFKDLISQSGELGSEHIGHNIFEGATSQVLNGAVLSVLSLLTTSQPNRRNAKLLGDTEAMKILAEQKSANFMQMDDTEDEVGELKPVGGGLGSTGVRGTMTSDDVRQQTKVNQQARVVPIEGVARCGTLVTSLQPRAFGTNLHGACSTAIIEQPCSISTLHQDNRML